MTPTVLHHMIILSLLLPIDAERRASADCLKRERSGRFRQSAGRLG
jgi:hypothetical protein